MRLLTSSFFPRWHAALYKWMTGEPDFGEVQRWYQGWKSMLPAGLAEHAGIKAHFTQALDLMNAAVAGQDLSALDPSRCCVL